MASPPEDVPATDETSMTATSATNAPVPPRRRMGRATSTDQTTSDGPTPPRRSPRIGSSEAVDSPFAPVGDATALATPDSTSWRASAAPVPIPDPVPVALVDDVESTSWRERSRQDRDPAPQGTYARYFRQTVTKVDLWSVTKLAVCFYLSAMFVTMVALVVLWMAADAAGVIASIEKFFGDLLSAKDFHFLSGQVLRGGILIGLVVVALQVVITVIAASFYNIFAELFGGVEIVVREEEDADEGYGDY